MAVVVDASAIAAVVFGEAEGETVRRGQLLYAPSLIGYELTHVAWKKMRRTVGSAVAISDALASVARLGMIHKEPDTVEVLGLAVATNLTPYDASYLWVAKTLGLKLVTLDQALARAAERV